MTERLRAPLCAIALLAVAATSAACTAPSEPTPGTAAILNIAGQWRGVAQDTSGPGAITLQLTQSGTSVSGTVTMTVSGTSITGRGSLTGTLTGSTLKITITIPAGGFDAPYTSCTASISGDGRATETSISVVYTGTNSCGGAVADGEMDLSRL